MGIKNMVLSDLNVVTQLYQDANHFARAEDIQNWTKNGLKKFPHLNFVYKINGGVAGAISAILKENGTAEINDLAVLKKERNKKIGTKLMNKLLTILTKLTKEESKKVSLWVHWSNAAAIPFYYKFGFKIKKCFETKKIPGVPDGEDVIYLEKTML